MSETKLLPCPFCGGQAIYETIEKDSFGEEMPVIFCNWCKVVFKAEDDSPFLSYEERYKYLKEKNAKAWNTRKPIDRILERLEGLAEKHMNNSEKAAELGKNYEKHMLYQGGKGIAFEKAIEIIKEEVQHEWI